jgi:hypothetical protein
MFGLISFGLTDQTRRVVDDHGPIVATTRLGGRRIGLR